jgi:hypothetical protein
MSVEYYSDSLNDWATIPIIDGTASPPISMAYPGNVSFIIHPCGDWVKNSVDGIEKYWIRFFLNNDTQGDDILDTIEIIEFEKT